MSTIRIKNIRTFQELDDIEKIWKTFESQKDGPKIFQSWDWNRSWCDYVLSNLKKSCLNVRLIEDGAGRTIAILPFFETGLAGPLGRLTQFLGHQMSYHNDILIAEPTNAELADAVIKVGIEDFGLRSVLHLKHLDSDSIFTKQLISRKKAEFQCARLKVIKNPNITDQKYRLGHSKRKTYKWAVNHLRKNFNCEFQVFSNEYFPKAFDEFYDLHKLRFTSLKRTTFLSGNNLAFFKSITSQLSISGKSEIIQLLAEKRPIAAALMIRDKHNYFCLQTGFNPEFSKFSPMRILLTEVMRRGFDDLDCQVFDFGPGYERYKYDWKPEEGSNYFCCEGGKGIYAKSLAAFYSWAFKRNLPK